MDQKDLERIWHGKSFRNKLWRLKETASECFFESVSRSRACKSGAVDYDARELPDSVEIAEQISLCIQNKSTIGIFGDYDADGVTSVAIWVEFCREIGLSYEVYVPNREDGYGASGTGIDYLLKKGVAMLLFLDCGSNSKAIVDDINIPVCIIDHHQIQEMPSKAKVMNPYRSDFPVMNHYKEICTAGLSFMFIDSFKSYFNLRDGFSTSLADLACIGTVGDVMPLNPFNLSCVKLGLSLINQKKRKSIASLCEVLKLGGPAYAGGRSNAGYKSKSQAKNELNYSKIAFYIVPCINAAGRISSAKIALDWILSTTESGKLSLILHSLNLQRREMEKEIINSIEVDNSAEMIFLKDEKFHPGIVGIISGRIKETYSKTCFVFYKSDGMWKGSARSDAHDLGRMIAESVNAGFAESGGGHKCAAGISVAESKFEDWSNWMLNRIKDEKVYEDFIEIDGFISESALDKVDQLNCFAPFGPGNAPPKLLLKDVWLKDIIPLGEHMRCVLHSGSSLFAFRCANSWGSSLKKRAGKYVDILLSVDEASIKIEDVMDSRE